MTGFFVMFWSTPTMTQGGMFENVAHILNILWEVWISNTDKGHLLFSTVASIYIYIAVRFFEEPDLVQMIGEKYENYMEVTPSFCPFYPVSKKKTE